MSVSIELRQASRLGNHAKPWVAKITGSDSKYRFSRQFVEADTTEYGSTWAWNLEPGIYEICDRNSKGAERRSFIEVLESDYNYLGADQVEMAFPALPKTESPKPTQPRKCPECGCWDGEHELSCALWA